MNMRSRTIVLATCGTWLLGGANAQSLGDLSFKASYVNDFRLGYSQTIGNYRADWFARQIEGQNQKITASVCANAPTSLNGHVAHLGDTPTGTICQVDVEAPLPQAAARLRWSLLRPHRVLPGRVEVVQTVTKALPVVKRRPFGKPSLELYCELPHPVPSAGGDACEATLNVPPRATAVPSYRDGEMVTIKVETLNAAGRVLETRSLNRRLPTYVPIVASLGDSAASGEGNPDRAGRAKNDNWDVDLGITPGSKDCEDDTAVMMAYGTKPEMATQPSWLEPKAHRSLKSGPTLAVRRLLSQWPYITFLSLAKSGAKIVDSENGNDMIDQLRRLKAVVGNRPVDALVISIGMNDMGFSGTLKSLVTGWVRTENPRERFQDQLNHVLQIDGFPKLKQYLNETGIDAKAVLLTGYPAAPFDSERGCGVFENLNYLTVTKPESALITFFGERLNNTLAAAAQHHGWHFIDGIDAAFRTYGYCAAKTYFRSAEESCRMQGDFDGTVHPNELGNKAYAEAISSHLRPLLQPAFPEDPVIGN